MTTPNIKLQKCSCQVKIIRRLKINTLFNRFYMAFISLFTFRKTASLSDAKMFEYVIKSFLGGDDAAASY